MFSFKKLWWHTKKLFILQMACPITSCLRHALANYWLISYDSNTYIDGSKSVDGSTFFLIFLPYVKNSPHRNNTAVWKSFQKSWPSLEVMNCSSLLNAKSLKVFFHTGIQNFRKLLHLFFTFHIHNIIITFCFTCKYVIQTNTKTIVLFFPFKLCE